MSEKENYSSPLALLITVMVSVFVVEFGIMLVLQYYIFLPQEIENVLDAVFSVILMYPTLYYFVFTPLVQRVTALKEINAAKSDFVSLASHQMRTPLTSINWYAEMLLGDTVGELNDKQKTYVKEIYAAGKQMSGITRSFLSVLRLETGQIANTPTPTDLKSIITSILQESKLDIEKKHLRIIEQYEESLSVPNIDKELTGIILQNLVSNAIKYTFEGKDVTISLANIARGSLMNGKTIAHDSVLVSVRGTNLGISKSDHDKIFTKFFRTEDARKSNPDGNGIGLYMTKKMVNIIGGTIWFESEEGKGTTFHVLFPLADI